MSTQKEIEVLFNSADDRSTALMALIEMGYKWHRSSGEDFDVKRINREFSWSEYPQVIIRKTTKTLSGRVKGAGGNTHRWPNDLSDIARFLHYNDPDPLSINLESGEYTVEVHCGKIIVGCQEISFDKFDEIAKAVETMRNL